MNTFNKKELLRKYPVGAKVKLLFMDDPYAPPAGSVGVIKGIVDLWNSVNISGLFIR